MIRRTTFLFFALLVWVGTLQAQNFFVEVQSGTDVDTFEIRESSFTPNRCSFPFTDTIAVAYDDGSDSTFYCSGTGSNDVAGKIALIDRGSCNFDIKVQNAQTNGASGVIICNRVDSFIVMSGDTSAAIPAVFTTKTSCDSIRARLSRDEILVATFKYLGDTSRNNKTILWGNTAGQGDFNGGLNGWTVEDNSCGGSPYDSDIWEWLNTPFVADIPSANDYANVVVSETFCNGFMTFNSQHLDAGDGQLGSGEGDCPSFQQSSLVSPTIDLSNHTGSISVNFYQVAIYFRGTYYLDYSEDGGETWVETEINTELGTNESLAGYRSVNLWGATPTATFKIRFRAALDYYYWAIDDILITEAPASDFEVNAVLPTPNVAIPASQTDSILLASTVYNLGLNPMYQVQNYYSVLQVVNNQFVPIYVDSFLLDTLNFQDSFIVSADKSYKVPEVAGVYAISAISIDSAGTDEDQSNNLQSYTFIVSEDFYSKDDGELLSIVPSVDDGKYTYANVYRTGVTGNSYRADSAVINIGAAFEGLQGVGSVVVGLYEWVNADSNAVASVGERVAVAFGEYTIDSTYESFDYVTIPLESVEGTASNPAPITLKDTTDYILSYEWSAPAGVSTDVSVTVGSIDYDFAGIIPYGPISLFASGNTSDWEPTTFQGIGYVAPTIRLSITDQPLINTSAEDIIKASLKVYPNPASTFVNVEMDLKDYTSDVQTIIYNMEGKVMQQYSFDNVRSLNQQLQLGAMPSGLYIIEFRTSKGSYSERILKY